MPRRGKLVDSSCWSEVLFANEYALLIGYLSMAVKGLGFLVLTWTTVVLLGGFVSTLQKKDFWCLTFITLVQTAGIFDVLLTEKLRYIWDSIGAVISIRFALFDDNPLQHKRQVLADVAAAVQQVLFVILLCPLAAVYMFGLLISSGISAWRLRQHDYGSDAEGLGNLKPALDVLYSIALLQGVIFCYKTLFGFAKGSVVNLVLKRRRFGVQVRVGISDYLLETMIGCEKDPSFARGRNLITYAVDLMGSKSPDDYVSGVRILDAFARGMEIVAKEFEEHRRYNWETWKTFMQEHILMKHLITSASSADVLQKLLQTLGLRSMCDRETRECAARIVANIAQGICLEEFPRGIHYISCLINTFDVYSFLQPYQRDWVGDTFDQTWYVAALCLRSPDQGDSDDEHQGDSDGDLLNTYKELMVLGFRILEKVAANNENCRIMLDTPRLLGKIMAPVTFDLLHQIDHGAWHSIVDGSLKVIIFLVSATGQTGTKLRSKISSSKEVMSTMERILECDKCSEKLQAHVILVLRHLYMDTSLIPENANKEKFFEMLVDIMTGDNKDREDRAAAAARALMALCSKTETGAQSIIIANDNAVTNLTIMVVQTCRFQSLAAKILEYLCIHCTTNDDENVKKLKKAMTDAVPKVFGEIVYWATKGTRAELEADQVRVTEPETDLENQSRVSQDNGRGNNISSSNQQQYKMDEECASCWLSLCVRVCDTLISADQDLPQFESTTPIDGVSSFPMKLQQIVKKNMHRKPDCLKIMKLTCKMVISMMKHRGSYVKEELESLMDTLSTASKDMFLLDGSVIFEIDENDDVEAGPEAFRSLASLVKEAQELVGKTNELDVETLSSGNPV